MSKKRDKEMVKERHTASSPSHMVISLKILYGNHSFESAVASDLDGSIKWAGCPLAALGWALILKK